MVKAIFGGSFDPPHLGHLLVMTAVLGLRKADEVLVVPCVSHPFGKDMASFEDRLAMCRFMIGGIGGRMAVSDVEKRKNLSGRTLDTVLAVRDEYPDSELRLLVGADILSEKDKWYRFEEIEKLASLIVVGRRGFEGDILPVYEASSTEIRERIRKGLNCANLVVPDILEYIKEKELYGYRRRPAAATKRV